ncbi:MAG: GSCFA domain-containing protein, partial [Aquaticitalea sp.]
MKLQTQIPIQKQPDNQIDYQSKLLLLGSCFVENIGNKLDYFKFDSLQNPFGILFHPKAIEILIHNSLHEKEYTEKDIFFHNEQWHCYDAHSKLSNNSKEKLLEILKIQLDLTAKRLNNSTHIIITLGTAWVYKHFKTNLPVGNCHKVDQKEFVKQLMSVEDVINSVTMIVQQIHQVNPTAIIIFTVSPVRHIKDGFTENSQSKAHLISALHHFI